MNNVLSDVNFGNVALVSYPMIFFCVDQNVALVMAVPVFL